MTEIDLNPMGKALFRLRESIEVFRLEPDNLHYLDSLIKRFEFSYELTKSTLLRYLEANSTKLKLTESPSMATLIRTANQDGLLRGNWEQWQAYRDARNQTSHAYDEGKARVIAADVPAFLAEAEFLYGQLQERLKDDESSTN